MRRESKRIEFKRELTDSFLKTVSAYANEGGGAVLFGVDDDGVVVGLENPRGVALRIENKINSTLDPIPSFSLTINADSTIELRVEEGDYKPYLYRGKAYRRADSSTVEVSRLELGRLVLEGTHQSFEELPASTQELTFRVLEGELNRVLSIKALSMDVLKTLALHVEPRGFNKAAELLADDNKFRGIDAARFGADINEIRERQDFSGSSVLSQFYEVVTMFNRWYRYERIDGIQRVTVYSVPEDAFREAVANALVHRTWDVAAPVRVSMHQDRIEVTSPGGLPPGITSDEYASGRFSLLRNPILAGVFFRLRYIEKFGTGITRIRHAYQNAAVQPRFIAEAASITVVLPTLVEKSELTESEQEIIQFLSDGQERSRAEIQDHIGSSRNTTIRLLNQLVESGMIIKTGAARRTSYRSNSTVGS
ncbi:MAG: Divergent AAA domain protein [Deltaproteobacteria bacterium ADurb.Bin058]|nr:MAG: Divergent AAA domain protein [Deltaproteobacteria bacterium ADurb.Bin058]